MQERIARDEAREKRIDNEALVDADTAEAVGDWHYWSARGNELG